MVVITPHNESIRYEFASAFSDWHSRREGVPAQIEWRDLGGTSDALRFVQSEFSTKPGGIGIDCFFGGGPEPFLLLASKRLLLSHKLPGEIMAGLPRDVNGVQIYDPGFEWYGAALSSFGILQSLKVQQVSKLPFVNQWRDLANPKLINWVGAGDPRNSGTMNAMFEAFLQAYGWTNGWSLLTQIAGNVRRFDRISSTTAKDVTLGETAYAFAIDFYGLSQIMAAGRENIAFVLPDDFTPLIPDGIGILNGAPNLRTAELFIDFVMSQEGQKIWFLKTGAPGGPQKYALDRMSVRPDIYEGYAELSNIPVSPFRLKQKFVYDSKLARERRDVVAALVGALLVDTHTELRSTWQAIVARGSTPGDLAMFGAMPLSDTEARQLAAEAWKDPRLRNQKKIEWQTWALRKYVGVRERR